MPTTSVSWLFCGFRNMTDQIPISSVSPFKNLREIATLLASGQVHYEGTRLDDDGATVYVLFSPAELAETIINDYYAYASKDIQPKVVLEKYDEARNIVFRARDRAKFQEHRNGEINDNF